MTPFHAGELAMQERVGMRERIAGAASFIRTSMPDQHREFFAALPFFFIGARDNSGQPWASMLAAAPGFLSTPDAQTLQIQGGLLPGDPLAPLLQEGAQIGGLGLEPSSRRRNRLNGEVVAREGELLRVAVRQSFGNCPKYIQQRAHVEVAPAPLQVVRGSVLTADDRALIERADTFFIASANLPAGVERGQGQGRIPLESGHGVDISHRGGRPGFVKVEDAQTLWSPEFSGNFFFNTLGNLALDPRAGLLFIDFERGDLLHLAVSAEIIWDGAQLQAFEGAERLLRWRVHEVLRNVAALPLRWSAPEMARQLERTGSWTSVAA